MLSQCWTLNLKAHWIDANSLSPIVVFDRFARHAGPPTYGLQNTLCVAETGRGVPITGCGRVPTRFVASGIGTGIETHPETSCTSGFISTRIMAQDHPHSSSRVGVVWLRMSGAEGVKELRRRID
jgi:hypothetical protein